MLQLTSPADTWRNNNVIMASKRRRFDVKITLLLRRAPAGTKLDSSIHGLDKKCYRPRIMCMRNSKVRSFIYLTNYSTILTNFRARKF